MKAIDIVWDQPELHLYHLADIHQGSKAADDPYLEYVVDIIGKDRFALVLLGGDQIEAISPVDRRFDPDELSRPIEPEHLGNPFYSQALRLVKRLEPIKKKIRVVIPGNHEYVAARRYYIEPTTIIAERLGAKCAGLSTLNAWIRILWRKSKRTRSSISVYMTHGNGGGELMGGIALKLERLLYRKNEDIILVGHHHRPLFEHKVIEGIGPRGNILPRSRIGIVNYPLCTGHNYAARSNRDPSPQGYSRIDVSFSLSRPPRMVASFNPHTPQGKTKKKSKNP